VPVAPTDIQIAGFAKYASAGFRALQTCFSCTIGAMTNRDENSGTSKYTERAAGVLLHITSLPSPWGVGDIGPGAVSFADFLCRSGQRYWQMLPIGPTDGALGDSPYSGESAFGGNVLFINPEWLAEDGLLTKDDLSGSIRLPEGKALYDEARALKYPLFKKAFAKARNDSIENDFQRFKAENAFWLDDYACFLVCKERFEGKPWFLWPRDLRDREPEAMSALLREAAYDLEFYRFCQFLFGRQWERLRGHCSQKGIYLVGDIPIYVSHDSADVWAHRELFRLDEAGRATEVAGVPPDYFSKDGQRWGNPLYRWDIMKERGFRWWTGRLKRSLGLFDILRIDHFRGFFGYWTVPASEATAKNGWWEQGPGDAFFKTLRERFPDLPFLAENLGVITPDVTEGIQALGVPGMRVLLFGFDGNLEENPHYPAQHAPRDWVYTGTHDNDTSRGWLKNEASPEARKNLESVLGKVPEQGSVAGALVAMAMESPCETAIIPIQDILDLGSSARLNRPSKRKGNWLWRLRPGDTNPDIAAELGETTVRAGR
ncbi:MAG: 4-alpha-glucanotransferase, partial [Synergistota bacterium]|nr:4-alpha-glucanotransferase [Synergistota bacterium]